MIRSETLAELVREQIRQRRYEPVVRLEFGRGADPAIRQTLCERFELGPDGHLRFARRDRLYGAVRNREPANSRTEGPSPGTRFHRSLLADEFQISLL